MDKANLQWITALNRGLSLLNEIYIDYKNGVIRDISDDEKGDIELFLTESQKQIAEKLVILANEK